MFKRRKKTLANEDLQGNRVFSYHSSRSRVGQNTGRLRKQDDVSGKESRPIGWFKRWLPTLTSLIIVGSLLSLLILGGDPGVRVIQSEGSIQRIDTSEYDKGISAIWKDSINNLTKLTARTSTAEARIREAYPELGSVRIELPFIGRRPLVTVIPAQAAAMIVNPTGAYYVSHQGQILSPVNGDFSYTGSQALITITDQSGLEPNPGEYVLNRDQIAAIRTYITGLEENNVSTKGVVLPAQPNQVDIVLDKQQYVIRFSFTEDPRQGIGAYLAAADTFTDGSSPQEYVDVRLPEKVFYK